jgi:hypothetical protein
LIEGGKICDIRRSLHIEILVAAQGRLETIVKRCVVRLELFRDVDYSKSSKMHQHAKRTNVHKNRIALHASRLACGRPVFSPQKLNRRQTMVEFFSASTRCM